MKSLLLILTSFTLPLLSSAKNLQNQDSALFKDGGNFYGNFLGFNKNGDILWKRTGAKTVQQFSKKELSQISLDGQRPKANAPQQGLLTLVNGDKLPADLLQINNKSLKIETSYAGNFDIDLKFVSAFSPTPIGEDILINGIQKNQNWKQVPFSQYAKGKSKNGKWEHKGASWYGNLSHIGFLYNEDIKLPDEFICTFDLASTGNGSVSIALQADLVKPLTQEQIAKLPEKERANLQINNKRGAANTIGNGITINFNNSYARLETHRIADNNQIILKSPRSNGYYNASRFSTDNIRKVELRVSRISKRITAYINGKLTGDWTIPESDYPKLGSHLGFFTTTPTQGSVRLSNLVISKWNGVKDSPLSLINQKKDLILHTNETDRFAGKIEKLENSELYIHTNYAKLKVPLKKLKLINFALNRQLEIDNDSDQPTIKFLNGGTVTGQLNFAKGDSFILVKTPYQANIRIPIQSISSIEFEEVSSLINSWQKKH